MDTDERDYNRHIKAMEAWRKFRELEVSLGFSDCEMDESTRTIVLGRYRRIPEDVAASKGSAWTLDYWRFMNNLWHRVDYEFETFGGRCG